MTGTAREVAGELWAVYGLPFVAIPTHRPVKRVALGAWVHARSEDRWAQVVESTRRMLARGRAVLIGTRSVAASEHVCGCLEQAGIPHVVLNARQDRDEAEVVARAGQPGSVTVATNMAGRGTDILLHPAVAQAGGLHVILTEYHESARIDRQLIGRGARQGDPGSHEAQVSLEDELFRRHLPPLVGRLLDLTFPSRRWAGAGAGLLRRLSQSRAEALQARARLHTLRSDAQQRKMMGYAGKAE
jgi:preprotein translocase subunit SecA